MVIFDFLFGKKKQVSSLLSDEELEIAGNRKMIKHLVLNGDKLISKREVFHWIYFKSETDRENYQKEVEKEGFIFVNIGKINDAFPYQLQIKRTDKVDEVNVNEYVLYLWRLAQNNNGNYDGWETTVESE